MYLYIYIYIYTYLAAVRCSSLCAAWSRPSSAPTGARTSRPNCEASSPGRSCARGGTQGDHLSNTTCLTHVFFRSCKSRSISEISLCFVGPRPWHIEIRHRVKKNIHNYCVRIWDSQIENPKIEIMKTDRTQQIQLAALDELCRRRETRPCQWRSVR